MATLFLIIGWVIVALILVSELPYLIVLFVVWALLTVFNLSLGILPIIIILALMKKLL